MKQNVIVLYSLPYKITDQVTGQITEGLQLYVYPTDDLSPTQEDTGYATSKGTRPMKLNLPISNQDKIKTVPALYEAEMKMQIKGNLKAELTLANIKYISNLTIEKSQPQSHQTKTAS